jgi:hypothetical protein
MTDKGSTGKYFLMLRCFKEFNFVQKAAVFLKKDNEYTRLQSVKEINSSQFTL